MTAMGSITLVEGVLGISLFNVHILRDFFNVLLLILTMGFTMKAIDIWNEKTAEGGKRRRNRDLDPNWQFGFRRFCLLATFFNCAFLLFTAIFDYMEAFHGFMESWEGQTHA